MIKQNAWSTTLGSKDKGVRKSEFVAKTQFVFINFLFKELNAVRKNKNYQYVKNELEQRARNKIKPTVQSREDYVSNV